MRLLFVIPHYFDTRPQQSGAGSEAEAPGHGSLRRDPRPRIAALTAAVLALHQTFGTRQCVIDIGTRTALSANADLAAEIDVIVCTTRGRHLLDKLPLDKGLYTHLATDAEPMLLGFACQEALRERLGLYDHYAYLEDDILVTDPLLLAKTAWFERHAGPDALLMPNRFERAGQGLFLKAYIDGDLAPRVTAGLARRDGPPILRGRCLGQEIAFVHAANPHSGCFFLSRAQMARLAAHPAFGQSGDTRFIGPLESAATLAVMRAFSVYKTAPAHMGFVEVEHFGRAFIGLIGTVVSPGPA